MQKRKYTKGYYFNRIAKSEIKNSTNKSHEIATANIETLAAITDKEITLSLKQNDFLSNHTTLQNCDTIFLNNGVNMYVKVLSVGDEKVVYKNCESTNDANYTLESSKVISIHYSDGNKITLHKNKLEEPTKSGTKQFRTFKEYKNNEAERGSKQLDNAVAWLAAGLIFSPAIIVGLILAALARKKLKDKDGYEQRFRLANTLTIVGAVILGIVILLFAFMIMLFGI